MPASVQNPHGRFASHLVLRSLHTSQATATLFRGYDLAGFSAFSSSSPSTSAVLLLSGIALSCLEDGTMVTTKSTPHDEKEKHEDDESGTGGDASCGADLLHLKGQELSKSFWAIVEGREPE